MPKKIFFINGTYVLILYIIIVNIRYEYCRELTRPRYNLLLLLTDVNTTLFFVNSNDGFRFTSDIPHTNSSLTRISD